jgi:hypothetical protein
VRNRFEERDILQLLRLRDAKNAVRDARRRRLQGCELEKRQNKTAPCAPALFIGPSAQPGISRCPLRLPSPRHNPSSGSMDMRASIPVVKSPDLAVSICATFSGHQD